MKPNTSAPSAKHTHVPSILLHTLIYLTQHTGPLDVSRESGASASQVEGTSGMTTLN